MSDVVFDYRPPRTRNGKHEIERLPPPPTYSMVQQVTTVINDPRLQKLNVLVAKKQDPQLYKLLSLVNEILTELASVLSGVHLNTLREDASRIARKMLRTRNKRGCGRWAEELAPRAVAIALALHGYGVYEAARTLNKVLGIEIDYHKLATCMRSVFKHHMSDFRKLLARHISFLANEFKLSPMQEYQAHKIAAVLRRVLPGRTPQTIASVAVYIVGKLYDKINSMHSVAEKLGLSEATIRSAIKDAKITINYYVDGKHVLTWKYGDMIGVRTPSMLAIWLVLEDVPRLQDMKARVEKDKVVIDAYYIHNDT